MRFEKIEKLKQLNLEYDRTDSKEVSDQMNRLIADIRMDSEINLGWEQIAELAGMTYNQVKDRGRLGRNKYYTEEFIEEQKNRTSGHSKPKHKITVNNDEIIIEEESEEVDDTPTPVVNEGEDWSTWNEQHQYLLRNKRYVKIAFLTDFHVPYHDNRAIECAMKMVEDFDPDIMPIGSDYFDFENLGRWESDPTLSAFEPLEYCTPIFEEHMDMFQSVAPNAIKPFLVGNHDIRFYDYLTKNAPKVRNSLSKVFTSLIRDNGGLWLGFKNITMRMSKSLIITHGQDRRISSGVTFTKDNVMRMESDIVQGHLHKLQNHTMTGETIRQAFGVGCMCDLYAHYSNSYFPENWQHGIALITIDTHMDTNHVENILIDNYQAVWGGRVYQG